MGSNTETVLLKVPAGFTSAGTPWLQTTETGLIEKCLKLAQSYAEHAEIRNVVSFNEMTFSAELHELENNDAEIAGRILMYLRRHGYEIVSTQFILQDSLIIAVLYSLQGVPSY
ncbi:MAG: hypothetical protein ABI758_00370 [Candidatus Woesebacteria bacterium]